MAMRTLRTLENSFASISPSLREKAISYFHCDIFLMMPLKIVGGKVINHRALWRTWTKIPPHQVFDKLVLAKEYLEDEEMLFRFAIILFLALPLQTPAYAEDAAALVKAADAGRFPNQDVSFEVAVKDQSAEK